MKQAQKHRQTHRQTHKHAYRHSWTRNFKKLGTHQPVAFLDSNPPNFVLYAMQYLVYVAGSDAWYLRVMNNCHLHVMN